MPVTSSNFVRLALLSLAAFAGSGSIGIAGYPCCCPGNEYTHYMWARTWHAQNSVTMPVSPYFVPRSPADCRSGAYYTAGGSVSGVAWGEPNQYGAYPFAPGAAAGFEPVQGERLGKVANEMGVGSLLQPGPIVAPAAAPRASGMTPGPAAL